MTVPISNVNQYWNVFITFSWVPAKTHWRGGGYNGGIVYFTSSHYQELVLKIMIPMLSQNMHVKNYIFDESAYELGYIIIHGNFLWIAVM